MCSYSWHQASTDEIDGIMAVISELTLLPEKESDPEVTATDMVIAWPPSPPPSPSPTRSPSLSPLRLRPCRGVLVFVMQGEHLTNEIRKNPDDVCIRIISAGGDGGGDEASQPMASNNTGEQSQNRKHACGNHAGDKSNT